MPIAGRAAATARALVDAGPLLSPDGSDSQSLDEMVELLVATGWDLGSALLAAMPEASSLRRAPHPHVATLRRGTAGLLAPWDGPAAIVFSDGRRVGAILDRNGLRPAAFAVTSDRLVAVSSEAGRDPARRRPTRFAAGGWARARCSSSTRGAARSSRTPTRRPICSAACRSTTHRGRPTSTGRPRPRVPRRPSSLRYLAGLDAEKARLDIKTMVIEAHEPLWSMGDDTPTPGLARVDRPVSDHLRQSFAQVTNPPIDPEREKAVMDLRVDLGRRPALLGGSAARRSQGAHPAAGPAGPRRPRRAARCLPAAGPATRRDMGSAPRSRRARDGPRSTGRRPPSRRPGVAPSSLVLSDRSFSVDRLPVPSVLAVGAVNTALTDAGLRGRADILVEAADVLDVHALAMTLAVGATAVVPWLAVELAIETAGSRGAEELTTDAAVDNLLAAFEAGLRKTLARMGISTVASYVGGLLFESLELDDDLRARCFPGAPAWPGTVGLADIAARLMRRAEAARSIARRPHVEPAAGPRLRPLPRRRRGPPVLAEERHGDHDARRGRRRRRGTRSISGGTRGPQRRRPRRPPNPPRSRHRVRSTSPTSSPPATSSGASSCRRCRSARSRRRPTRR